MTENGGMALKSIDDPRTRMNSHDSRWWEIAACSVHDPEWWCDASVMRHRAVEVCLTCPVRTPCLDEALAVGDHGVIRAGMLITVEGRRVSVVPLMCVECGVKAARGTRRRQARYCSPGCTAAAGARALNRAEHIATL
jgi:hypothetical protein